MLVHIADISYYVRKERPSMRRLLPGAAVFTWWTGNSHAASELSNSICSLNAGEDRLTMTVIMEIDRKGAVQKYDVFSAVIRVTERMTYDVVLRLLEAVIRAQELPGSIAGNLPDG